MSFEYFYGGQSEAFSFYRIPRRLVTGSEFRHLSTEAKLLYGLLLDRMGLSAQNEWYDDQGRVYIYYTVEEIMEDLCCGHGKAGKLLAELDTSKGIGLIERRKQGQGKPTMIYVKQFVEHELPALPRPPKSGGAESRKPEVKTSDNRRSGQPKNEGQDIRKSDANYTDSNYTKNSYIDPSNPPSGCSETERAEIEEDTREQISYSRLAEEYPYDDPDCLLQLICDILCSTAETTKIGGEPIPTSKVKERFQRLDYEHIVYVLDCMRETTTKIINIRAYLLTALYNAPITIGPHYAAAVRHDFG